MAFLGRRNFLKRGTIALLPTLLPAGKLMAADDATNAGAAPSNQAIKLFGDGEMFAPDAYIAELSNAFAATKFEQDRYGVGGAVAALENKFAAITGKEKAIFMPSGTMANQLALSVLGGDKSKVFVQDTSHVYRDEADAAQSIFYKRLMPLAPGETYFTAQQLQHSIEALAEAEVFETGIGAVSIENPVRRTNGKTVPLAEIKKIADYCRAKNIRLHLDGARIFMAAAWTGVSVKEYAAHFDTVYISLYKYFGASAGAVLCGSKEVIDKMPRLMKVHGGSMYGNWTNAAMALHRLQGFEERLQKAIETWGKISGALNKISGIKIAPMPGGTNIYSLALSKAIDGTKMHAQLNKEYNIKMPRPDEQNHSFVSVNETLLYQPADYVIHAFKTSIG